MNNYLLYFIQGSCRFKSLHFKKVLFPENFLSMVSMVLREGQAFGGSNCYLRKNTERGVTSSSADFQRRKNIQVYGYKWPRFCFVVCGFFPFSCIVSTHSQHCIFSYYPATAITTLSIVPTTLAV